MKKAFHLSLLTVFFLIPLHDGFGQATLTWEDAIKEASTHNLDLMAAEQTVKASENSKTASLGQFFPQVSFNASIDRYGSGGFNDALNSPYYGQGANISLSATENIFSGFKDYASVDLANAQLDLARTQLQQEKAQLSHDLKTYFYTLLYTQQEIGLLEDIVKRDQANQDLVQMNFDGGTDNKGSLLQAEAATEQDKLTVVEAKRSLRVAERNLDQVLGRNPMADVQVEGTIEVPTLPDGLPDFVDLTAHTPAHVEAVDQVRIADSQYVTARAALFPTLSANASLSDGGLNFDELPNTGWEAGLSLSFPFFDGGSNIFTMQSAAESKKGVSDTLHSTDLKTESLLESDYTNYQNSIGQYKVQQFTVEATQVQEQVAKVEYLNGLLIFVNWNEIETNLTTQQKTLLSYLLVIKTAEASWELDQGKGVIP